MIDGQQRTLSICQYVNGDFSIKGLAFHNLQDDQQEQILDYKLMVYFCSGTDSEKLDWFRTINIAGEELTDQELRNAVYAGPWTADAKRYFSKTGCPAYGLASDYMQGSPIRQEYLETAIEWHSKERSKSTCRSISTTRTRRRCGNISRSVIGWVKATFPKYRKEMKGVGLGQLSTISSRTRSLIRTSWRKQIAKLMRTTMWSRKSGIYPYVLDGDERHLNIRAFSDNMKREAYERQKGVCVKCKKKFQLDEMEGDHIKPWHEGGKTNAANCQMLCKDDNRRKSGK